MPRVLSHHQHGQVIGEGIPKTVIEF
jgi:hypothetical protein